jgi:hypothetical protein
MPSSQENIIHIVVDVTIPAAEPQIIVSDALKAYGLAIHRFIRVIVCVDCQMGLIVPDVIGHLRKKHHMSTGDLENDLAAFTEKYQLVTRHGECATPTPRGAPIELLTIHNDAYGCGLNCPYVSLTKSSMSHHIRTAHPQQVGRREKSQAIRTGVVAQTVFKTIGIKYFEVNPSLRDKSDHTCLSIVTREWIDKLPPLAAPTTSSSREVNPLLQKMQWHIHLQEYTSSELGIARIKSLGAIPQHDEFGYDAIIKASLEYLTFARTCADEFGMLLKRIIIQGPNP